MPSAGEQTYSDLCVYHSFDCERNNPYNVLARFDWAHVYIHISKSMPTCTCMYMQAQSCAHKGMHT